MSMLSLPVHETFIGNIRTGWASRTNWKRAFQASSAAFQFHVREGNITLRSDKDQFDMQRPRTSFAPCAEQVCHGLFSRSGALIFVAAAPTA